MQARTLVFFDDHCLSDYCHISNVVRPQAGYEMVTRTIPGSRGTAVLEQRMLPITISMQLNFLQQDPEMRRAAMELVEGWLHEPGMHELNFTDQSGSYMVFSSKRGNLKKKLTSSIVNGVEFYCPDPVRYGQSYNISASSGTTLNMEIGGNYPTILNISSSAAVGNSSNLWRATVDGNDYVKTVLTSGSHAVLFDSENRVHKIDGVSALMTDDSMWMDSINPGSHSVAVTLGSGPVSVEWSERWV